MKQLTRSSLLFLVLALSFPLSVFASQSGGGYTVNDHVNPVSGGVSGGGFNSQAGGSPIGQVMTGNGFSSVGGVVSNPTTPAPGTSVPTTPAPVTGGGSNGGAGLLCPTGTSGSYPNCVPGGTMPLPSNPTYAQIVAATPVGQVPVRVDLSRDNVIDIIDFNLLMVHWGKVAGDPNSLQCNDKLVADINCDSRVDILDFNLLLVYWGKSVMKR